MSDLVSQGGKLVVRDGKLGTGQGCCCGGGQTCGCNGLEDGLPCTFYFPDCVSNPDAAVGYSWDPFFSGGAGNGQGSFVIPIFGGWKEDYPYPAFGSCRYLVVTTFQASPSGQAARIYVEDCVAREWIDVTEEAAADIDALSDGVPPDDLCLPAMVCGCADGELPLQFSSCFGADAAGMATIEGGVVTTADATGTGYAKLGRVAPTLTISGGSGTGATFTPTLANTQDGCDLDLWSLESVAVSGGTGYVDGDTLTITAASGDTVVAAATAILRFEKDAPTLTLEGTATATVNVEEIGNGNWRVASVTVTAGGSSYTDGESLTFDLGVDDVEVTAATAVARVVYGEPQNPIQNESSAGGSGAVITPTWELIGEELWPGAVNQKTYRISSVTITNAGAGYAVDDTIEFSFASDADGFTAAGQVLTVLEVDGGGAITEIGVADDGAVIGAPTDELESVAILTQGSYYKETSDLAVEVTAGGTYYREDASVPPYVADVTVSLEQNPYLQAGSGASLSVVIDDDTGSATFGHITAVNVSSGGSGYRAVCDNPLP